MHLIHELKRRNVFRVAAGYIALAWLAIQIAETVFPAFGLADTVRIVVLAAAIGFIPVLAFAWVFELTPEGFRRDREVDRDSEAVRRLDKRLDRVAVLILALAVGYFAFDKFVLDPARDEALRKSILGDAANRGTSGSLLGDTVLVTKFSGSHSQPTLSPDGGRMAFVSPDEHGVQQIWVLSLPDGEPVQITRGEAAATEPSWSPADDSILFQRAFDKYAKSIWLVDAPGTKTPRLVVPGGGSPRFAPDGNSFVFNGTEGVTVGFLDGSPAQVLKGVPEAPGFAPPTPAINAAGDIVFVLADSGPIGNLWIYEAASSQFRQLTRSATDWSAVAATWPVWMPDGRTVIYVAPVDEMTNTHLWQIDTVTGRSEKLTSGPGGYAYPVLSGDGSRLAYVHARPVWRLIATDPSTEQDHTVHESRNVIALPLVSPDGRLVVYFGEDGVYTVPVAGGRAEKRTFGPPAEATLPFWSRSDQSIYYFKGRALHRLDPDTGLSDLILEEFHWTSKNWPAVYREQLAYHLKGDRRTVLHDLASGEERLLDEQVLPSDWSRDGKRLLGRGSGSRVVVCLAPEFRCEPILDGDGSPVLGAIPRWSADESRVFFRRALQDKPGYAGIWSVPVAGGEARLRAEVGPYDGTSMSFGIAEGDVIIWNEVQPAGRSEIWMTDRPANR
jgi:Tol biopolymer transport system component